MGSLLRCRVGRHFARPQPHHGAGNRRAHRGICGTGYGFARRADAGAPP